MGSAIDYTRKSLSSYLKQPTKGESKCMRHRKLKWLHGLRLWRDELLLMHDVSSIQRALIRRYCYSSVIKEFNDEVDMWCQLYTGHECYIRRSTMLIAAQAMVKKIYHILRKET